MDGAGACRLRSLDWRYLVVTVETLWSVETVLTGFSRTDLRRIARRSCGSSLQYVLDHVAELPTTDALVLWKFEAAVYLSAQ